MERQFSTFFLGDALFGLDILMVNEINRQMDITPVDQAQDFVAGLLNLRGQIVTVLDLGVRLSLGPRTITPNSCIIVLKTNAEILERGQQVEEGTADDVVGLLVDRIGDMVTVEDGALEPPPANMGGVDGRFMSGVAKLANSLLVVLRAKAILQAESVNSSHA